MSYGQFLGYWTISKSVLRSVYHIPKTSLSLSNRCDKKKNKLSLLLTWIFMVSVFYCWEALHKLHLILDESIAYLDIITIIDAVFV